MSTIPEEVRKSYGELPKGWHLDRLKFFCTVRNSNVDKKISEAEQPIRLCNYTDVYYNDRITSDLEFMEGSATTEEIDRFKLKACQVILTKDSESWLDIGIPALVTEDMPNVICGYHLAVIDPGTELCGAFLAWLCRAEPLNDQFKLGANGVTRFGLGQYPLKNAFIAVPPLETQRRIARFLDDKTARIDLLIEQMTGRSKLVKNQIDGKSLCGLLLEYRGALITAAVTGQLDTETDYLKVSPKNAERLNSVIAEAEAGEAQPHDPIEPLTSADD